MFVDAIRAAREARQTLRIAGAGTWLGAGRPVHADATVSVSEHRGIVEYVPGDLTLTARAGTPLSELRDATRAHDQWLPLDPWGGDTGTIGATVSTATAGPHAYSMGLPRDVVLGLEFVSGSGDTIRAGGRVVKNVAGFDLTRLLIGSWGSLGIITEVTVRLRARPAELRTLLLDVPSSRRDLNDLAARLRALPFTPLASELVNPALAKRLGLGQQHTLILRLGGNTQSVSGQLDLLGRLGALRDGPADVWQRLRAPHAAETAAWRWSQLSTLFGDTWMAAQRAAHGLDNAFIHGNPARGVVRVLANGPGANLWRAAGSFTGTIAIECLPHDAWPNVPVATGRGLSVAIRATFNPGDLLNPGITGEDA